MISWGTSDDLTMETLLKLAVGELVVTMTYGLGFTENHLASIVTVGWDTGMGSYDTAIESGGRMGWGLICGQGFLYNVLPANQYLPFFPECLKCQQDWK